MVPEVLRFLAPTSGGVYFDGTLGSGGHAEAILERLNSAGAVVGIDRDEEAVAFCRERLSRYGKRIQLVHGEFGSIDAHLDKVGVQQVDGFLLDLGVSSHQLDSSDRGFSYSMDGPLDMRMDRSRGLTAADVLQQYSAEELARIFREYGEERYARRIARRIAERREETPLVSTGQLASLVQDSVPRGRVPSRIHPATRVFQALRIEVNGELEHVARGLDKAIACLRPGGRLAVISFHSLEDRLVKRCFRREAQTCICPPGLPTCICNHRPRVELLTRKGLRAGEEEVAANPRARSAVLRAVRRCPD